MENDFLVTDLLNESVLNLCSTFIIQIVLGYIYRHFHELIIWIPNDDFPLRHFLQTGHPFVFVR